MERTLRALMTVAALAAVTGCATAGPQAAGSRREYPTGEIASLERDLAGAPDSAALPRLLLARGHAYLLEAESWLKAHPDPAERRRSFERYGGYFLRAMSDFEEVVTKHADSPEAPEAMFHLGIVYDYPNISDIELALGYYRRTVERYPGTEWARRAQEAVDDIQELLNRVRAVSPGK